MKRVFVLALAIILLAMLAMPVSAATVAVGEPTGGGFDGLLTQWAGMAGFAGLIALLINVGKTFGVVKDGQAQTWSAVLNLFGLAVMLALNVFRPGVDIGAVDQWVSGFVEVATVVLTYIMQILVSRGAHYAVAGLPVIGKSHTVDMLKRALG